MRILFISPYVPSLIRVRPYNWIKFLAAAGHDITLVALVAGPDDEAALAEMKALCEQVIPIAMPRWRPVWNCLLALSGGEPLQLAYNRLPAMDQAIRQVRETRHFDVAHIEHLRAACFAPALAGLPIIYDAVDSISLLFERTARSNPRLTSRLMAGVDLKRTARFEGAVLDHFARVLVTSPDDAAQFRRLAARPFNDEWLIALPNGVDLSYFQPTKTPRRPDVLLFSGKMSYHANVAAALYMSQEIMPLIWQQRPDIQLWIVGKDPTPAVQALTADQRITVTGFVPDLRPYLAEATVSVSPMTYGTGIQNKVLEALACEVPVVTSSQTCKALAIEPGRDLLVADTAADFATAVLSLLDSPSLRDQLACGGRAYVEQNHNWQVLAERLTAVYDSASQEFSKTLTKERVV